MNQNISAEEASSTSSPLKAKHVRDTVREHVGPIGNLMTAASSMVVLVGGLDFFSPYTRIISQALYTVTGAVVLVLVLSAIFPSFVDKWLAALGFQVARSEGSPMWKSPSWRAIVVLLVLFSAVGFVSVAKASQGGLLASQSSTIRNWQEELLQLRHDMADVKAGVDAANNKLDTLVADSKDPQKDVVARGYQFSTNGLIQALKQGDRNAVGLFAKAHLRVEYAGPMLILMRGEQPWDQTIADTLTKDMFYTKTSCQAGTFMEELKPPSEARLRTFKRLCDPAEAIARLEKIMSDESARPTPGERYEKVRKDIPKNLATLRN